MNIAKDLFYVQIQFPPCCFCYALIYRPFSFLIGRFFIFTAIGNMPIYARFFNIRTFNVDRYQSVRTIPRQVKERISAFKLQKSSSQHSLISCQYKPFWDAPRRNILCAACHPFLKIYVRINLRFCDKHIQKTHPPCFHAKHRHTGDRIHNQQHYRNAPGTASFSLRPARYQAACISLYCCVCGNISARVHRGKFRSSRGLYRQFVACCHCFATNSYRQLLAFYVYHMFFWFRSCKWSSFAYECRPRFAESLLCCL